MHKVTLLHNADAVTHIYGVKDVMRSHKDRCARCSKYKELYYISKNACIII